MGKTNRKTSERIDVIEKAITEIANALKRQGEINQITHAAMVDLNNRLEALEPQEPTGNIIVPGSEN
jgi:hypothetical protein